MNEQQLVAWPTWRSLFHGAVREALAHARCVAQIGAQESRSWEKPVRYIADDSMGNVGVVQFRGDGAVAVMIAKHPSRSFSIERGIEMAPESTREELAALCGLPMLQGVLASRVSAIFWTEGEFVRAAEPWRDVYLSGAELFSRELLPDAAWVSEAISYYGVTPDVGRLAIEVAARAEPRDPIVTLSKAELSALVPDEATPEHKVQAEEFLFGGGAMAAERTR